jgi:hypothetical protein
MEVLMEGTGAGRVNIEVRRENRRVTAVTNGLRAGQPWYLFPTRPAENNIPYQTNSQPGVQTSGGKSGFSLSPTDADSTL